MKKQKVIFYSDELNDDFSEVQGKVKKIDETYDYGIDSKKWNFKHFFWYQFLAKPVSELVFKFIFRQKIVNREAIKPYLGKPFFMYANHTNMGKDPFVPSYVTFPKDIYVIISSKNLSAPVIGKIIPYLGGLPLPETLGATKNFLNAIKTRISQNHPVMIYPEAHIWPYYTKIRPFTDLSFRYPVQYKVPVFCFTNTYQKRKFSSKPKIVTYVDGPFFPNPELSQKEQKADLRDKVYNAMVLRSKNNSVEIIKYVKKETEPKTESENQ